MTKWDMRYIKNDEMRYQEWRNEISRMKKWDIKKWDIIKNDEMRYQEWREWDISRMTKWDIKNDEMRYQEWRKRYQ